RHPGGLDEYFADLHAAGEAGAGPHERARILAAHGIVPCPTAPPPTTAVPHHRFGDKPAGRKALPRAQGPDNESPGTRAAPGGRRRRCPCPLHSSAASGPVVSPAPPRWSSEPG